MYLNDFPSIYTGTVEIPSIGLYDGKLRYDNAEDTYDTLSDPLCLGCPAFTLSRMSEDYEDMGNGRQIFGITDLLDRFGGIGHMLLPDTDDQLSRINQPVKKHSLMDFPKDKKSPKTMNHFLRDRKGQKAMLHFLRDRKAVRNRLSHFLRDRKTYLTKNHFLRDRRSINMDMLRSDISTKAKKELNHLLRDRRSQPYFAIH